MIIELDRGYDQECQIWSILKLKFVDGCRRYFEGKNVPPETGNGQYLETNVDKQSWKKRRADGDKFRIFRPMPKLLPRCFLEISRARIEPNLISIARSMVLKEEKVRREHTFKHMSRGHDEWRRKATGGTRKFAFHPGYVNLYPELNNNKLSSELRTQTKRNSNTEL